MNETVLPRAILMDLKTGQQFEVNLQSDINPWPTEPDEEEPAQPMVFNKTVTFKMTKKDQQAFKRLMRKQSKVPRKLKKALKHVGFFQLPMERIETENGFALKQTVGFGPKDGYPCTKWVNRACIKLQANDILIAKRQISAENYKQRGPHSYLLPPTSNLITHNRTTQNSQLK